MARRNRRIRAGVLLSGALALLALGAGGTLVRPPTEPDRVLRSRFGDVPWNHERHARMKDIANCQVCHHKERPGTVNPRPCGECHKPASNEDAVPLADLHMEIAPVEYSGDHGPPAMTAFHGRCVGCHRAMNEGPVGCRDCHVQEFSGAHGVVRWDHRGHARLLDLRTPETGDDNCLRCHHQDRRAATDGDYRPCGACHEPAETLGLPVATGLAKHENLKHFDCERCHVGTNPEDDLRTCKDCHSTWAVDTKKMRPPIEQAIHERCRECHNDQDAAEGMPARCEDCHRPDPSVIADLEVGLILWDHDRHAAWGEKMSCDRCHHTDRPGQPHMRCSRCHGTGLYRNPSVAEALRKRCLGCHDEKENGLVSWEQIASQRRGLDRYRYEMPDGRSFFWDHRRHAVAWSFSCRNCHHPLLRRDGEYVTGAKAGVPWEGKATHVQSCRNCHGAEGPVPGSPAAGTKAPPLHEAFTKACLECHRRFGAGPEAWEDIFRVEPVDEPEGTAAAELAARVRLPSAAAPPAEP